MRPFFTATVLLMGAFLLVHAGEEKTDLDRMQGAWLVESLVEEGKAVPAAEREILEITIDKDTYTCTEKGKGVVAKYKIKVDSSKKPKEIDFTPLIGDDKDKKQVELAIYMFEKDQIKICIDEKGKGRPTAFEGKETEVCSVIVLKKKEAK